MTVLRKRFIDDLTLSGYSKSTIKNYVGDVRRLAKHYMYSPDKLSVDQIRNYILHLINIRNLSCSSIKSAVRSIELFYILTLKRNWQDLGIIKPKSPKKLPVVLSHQEANRVLEATKNLKHKTMLTIAYSAGLRNVEIINLKVNNIDSDRMLIRIDKSKFSKQRFTILGKKTLSLINEYKKVYNPNDWLFPSGQNPLKHLTARTLQKELKRSVKKAGITKEKVVVHTLRHSFATKLVEEGINLRIIQKLLGHKHISSTAIYTHVSKQLITTVQSPIDFDE